MVPDHARDLVLHGEYLVTVVGIHPWGVVAETHAGERVVIDVAKVGASSVRPGAIVRVVVLDDARQPARVSADETDLRIAAQLRSRS